MTALRMAMIGILCLMYAPRADASEGAGATQGLLPDNVSVVKFPRPIGDVAYPLGIARSIIFGNCFFENISLGVDTCTLPVLEIPLVCVRFTSALPYGFIEASDRYAHTSMNVLTLLHHMSEFIPPPKSNGENSALNKAWEKLKQSGGRIFNLLTKDMNNVYAQEATGFGRSGHKYAQGLGRSGPMPSLYITLMAILEVMTLGTICSVDFQIPSIAGRWWFLADANTGITSSWRGIPSSSLFNSAGAGFYWTSIMTTLFAFGSDILGFTNNGQSSDLIPRGGTTGGAQVVGLTRASAIAWDTVNAPFLFWGILHWRPGGYMNQMVIEEGVSIEGMLAMTPMLQPFVTYYSSLWPGDLHGCPAQQCHKYMKIGEMGLNAATFQVPAQEATTWNKASRALVDKNLAVILWPKLTCCRICQLDIDAALARQYNLKVGDEFLWAFGGGTESVDDRSIQKAQLAMENMRISGQSIMRERAREVQEKQRTIWQTMQNFFEGIAEWGTEQLNQIKSIFVEERKPVNPQDMVKEYQMQLKCAVPIDDPSVSPRGSDESDTSNE